MTDVSTTIAANPAPKGRRYDRAHRRLAEFYPYASPNTLDAMATDQVQISRDYFKKDFPRHQLPMLLGLGAIMAAGVLKSKVSATAAKVSLALGFLGIIGSAAFRYFDVGTSTQLAVASSEFAHKYEATINDPRANSPLGKIFRQLYAANPTADPRQLMVQARQEALRQSVMTSRINKAFMMLTGIPLPFARPVSRKIYDHRNSQPTAKAEPVTPLARSV